MSDSTETVRSLLLCAPPEKRLDLAIASLLFPVRREHLELILAGRRQLTPAYFFFDTRRNYDAYFYSPDSTVSPPGRSGHPAPNPVSSFATSRDWAWAIQEFVQFSQVTYTQGELCVVVSNGSAQWEERAAISPSDFSLHKERETCRLLALAALHVYAPELLLLLDAPQQEEPVVEGHATPTPVVRLIQELVLVPVFLPSKMYEDVQCQHQAYDIRSQTWCFCSQDWEGDEQACCPGQCPACGGYYCERHTSEVSYIFESSREELRFWGCAQVTLRVCVTCVLLSEEQVRQLRAARLTLAGEPPHREADPS